MNLPKHLQERIRSAAYQQYLSEQKCGLDPESAYIDSFTGFFLAGASFLYSLLKEEKGEVGRWVKGTDRVPKGRGHVFIKIEGTMAVGHWNTHHKMFINESDDFFPEDQVEWLDTETPVVAGCGELVEALEWYADPGNYLDENGNLATAWKNNEAIARKATSALKTFKR
jgi:hypothetical protein